MKWILTILCCLVIPQCLFAQQIALEEESGLYELQQGEYVLINSLRFDLLFQENKEGDLQTRESIYKVMIAPNKSLEIRLKEYPDSLILQSRYLYKNQQRFQLNKSVFENIETGVYSALFPYEHTYGLIYFYESLPLYLLIDYPLKIRNKGYVVHLKPDFFD
jgi:hypothetical protein